MLVKLLKYDLKYMLKNMMFFYIFTIFFAVLTRVLSSFDDIFIMMIISKISFGFYISMIANIVINVLMRSWVRFRDSIFKDESYLTHTLPVSKNDIYNSKFLQTLIFYMVSFIVVIISLFIAFYTKENWESLKLIVKTFTASIDFSVSFFLFCFFAVMFLEIFNALQCGYLGILLGHRKNNAKIGFSVVFGFIAYLMSQSMVLALVYIVGLFNSDIMDLFKNNIQLDPKSFKLLANLAIILYVVIITIMSFICKKIFNKGVNIE